MALFKSELVIIPCPLCNHTHLWFRESPVFQFGCYGDTHYHLYCGKCHTYICTQCNPEFTKVITKMAKSHIRVRHNFISTSCLGRITEEMVCDVSRYFSWNV